MPSWAETTDCIYGSNGGQTPLHALFPLVWGTIEGKLGNPCRRSQRAVAPI